MITDILHKWSWPKSIRTDAAVLRKMQVHLMLPWDKMVG